MKRKNFKKFYENDEEGFRKPSFTKIKQEKDRKKIRNFSNALKSKNLNVLLNYED